MNPVRAALLGLATLTGSGCFNARLSGPDWFYHHAARNLTEKPIAHHDERKFTRMVERRAKDAWEQVCGSSGWRHSDPYGHGFREGFVDYVEAGGTGEPPYLPPFRYRLTKYRTTEGLRAIEDWYAGFRHGAAVARGSGLRELNYIPLPGPAIPVDAHGAPPSAPHAATVPPAPTGSGPKSEALPAPRQAPGSLPQMPPPIPPASKFGGAQATPASAIAAPAGEAAEPAGPWEPNQSTAENRKPVVRVKTHPPTVLEILTASSRSKLKGDFGSWQSAETVAKLLRTSQLVRDQ
ncbi:hypothetical protein GobsT_20380 [Gemmata obscuriglobus]|uniref:Uncharacterized protein n=1 Tax=Gemmata obscuriglobus TaxID=114 RepID=A0A2Z3H7R8_9BACT|nr:hypothetical protein [Gemmata obscuriglobus]AWM39616.1 hypothetical protein C1280_23200 [Gemmata obscuriglobus]QEG27284.1 hypothetical protein GobsT_20380 [Gemmata obscuriglobus]VTS04083.1 Uncharacterized protein OS=Planctomyces brasiliensis (strain ATCC 49424 / DSM 5305 / JCM 21570 / NBRC 103401 / IFAM 1448) GN=Plabr_4198 PE=4 SV=1 [Gemmata obscuriglobus UQM 2246]